jgi:hypothetical protein
LVIAAVMAAAAIADWIAGAITTLELPPYVLLLV